MKALLRRSWLPLRAVAPLAAVLLSASGCIGSLTGDLSGDDGEGTDAGALPPPGTDGAPYIAPGTDAGPPPLNINEGFIGSACSSDLDCDYAGGFCAMEEEGFPLGMCSSSCDLYCPDQPGAVTTFCIDPVDIGVMEADGLCSMRCDYGESPTGCRPGYQCAPMARHNDPGSIVYTCIPGNDRPFELGACHEELIARGVGFTPGFNPMAVPSGNPNAVCDVVDPIWVNPEMNGVTYHGGSFTAEANRMFVRCELALALEETAALVADVGISEIGHWGTYNCRTIAGSTSLSQHGLANAIDIRGFRATDGTVITVLNDWYPAGGSGGMFLRWLAQTWYDEWIFNIILTPEYNADHADHFHVDLTDGSHFLSD